MDSTRSISVVTTFSPAGWITYGKNMVDTFVKNWPEEIQLLIYFEDKPKDANYGKRVKWINFHDVSPDLVNFKQKYKTSDTANGIGMNPKTGKYSYLWDAVKFSHKSFCVSHATLNASTDIVIWLDADVVTHSPVSKEAIEGLLPEDHFVTYLGRQKIYPECGFVMYNCKSKFLKPFMETWKNLYNYETIFELDEWHDSFLFQHVVNEMSLDQNFKHASISGEHPNRPGVHVFINSPLGQYMDHLKGARIITGKSKIEDLYVNRKEDYWKKVK